MLEWCTLFLALQQVYTVHNIQNVCVCVWEFASVFVAPYSKRRYSCVDKFMHERRSYPFFFVFIIDAHFDSTADTVVTAAEATKTYYYSLTRS